MVGSVASIRGRRVQLHSSVVAIGCCSPSPVLLIIHWGTESIPCGFVDQIHVSSFNSPFYNPHVSHRLQASEPRGFKRERWRLSLCCCSRKMRAPRLANFVGFRRPDSGFLLQSSASHSHSTMVFQKHPGTENSNQGCTTGCCSPLKGDARFTFDSPLPRLANFVRVR